MVCAVTSNSRASSAGVLPARTNSTICSRNSAGYGGLVLPISNSLLYSVRCPSNRGNFRRQSALVVTPQDVEHLDDELVELVRRERAHRSILIDSHPVTKEQYGFRVTGFDAPTIQRLSPDILVCLYAPAEVTRSRIQADAMGRPLISEFESQMHTHLQAAVVTQYGVLTGKAVYFLDSSATPNALTEAVLKWLR
ncbi:ATP-binding protein [Paracidovorax citrulli]|uniref:ATP-binding protein n=1 Tax=Paracidovorax citrulli TaxID=80869 RepID=UPI001F10D48C|nr:ATP-binding protein [Paracidovorax citrulli]UMT82247.1 AAA family ATPase [Paracidovorax citrulli]WIY30488.1 ATP-binding protein [Paracidovorax citrulli]